MYGDLNVVDVAEKLATAVALKDRLQYRPFMEVIEQFISRTAKKPELVVGGKTATHLLLRRENDPPPLDAFTIELFSGKAPQHARQLADLLYAVDPNSLGHYVKLDIRETECAISVNGRDMVKIRLLPAHRGEALADMVIPTDVPAQFITARLPCMGPEIQLVDIYRALCDPARAESWPELLRDEKRLRTIFLHGIKAKFKEATGGREKPADAATADFWHAVQDKFVRGAGRVVVGRAASSPATIHQGRRLQLVTANHLREEAEDLQRLASAHSVKVTTAINDPSMPIDPRLERLTGYIITGDGKREAFIDIFGAGQYELVPWVGKAEIRTGTAIVVMRFRLVDIWTMQLLLHIKSITPGFARSILHETLHDYEKAASDLDQALAGPPVQAVRSLFPFLHGAIGDGCGFVGHWENPDIYQKRRAFSARKDRAFFVQTYYPAAKKSAEKEPPAAGAGLEAVDDTGGE
jgi:hypothetical protein